MHFHLSDMYFGGGGVRLESYCIQVNMVFAHRTQWHRFGCLKSFATILNTWLNTEQAGVVDHWT